jgi:hypothetical protein
MADDHHWNLLQSELSGDQEALVTVVQLGVHAIGDDLQRLTDTVSFDVSNQSVGIVPENTGMSTVATNFLSG